MEKVFSPLDEEGHLLFQPINASSGLRLTSAAEFNG